MTLQEALDKRIPRIRMPQWANPQAYLRLPLFKDGYGPWAELYDSWGQEAIGVSVGSQKILVVGVDTTAGDYEVYDGEPHPSEADNYSSAYEES